MMKLHRRFALPALALAVAMVVAPLTLVAQTVTLSRGTAEEVGMSPAVLEAGVGLYREAVDRGDLVGAVLLVARNGKVVLHEAIGSRYAEANLPMEKNTMFRMASNTKPVIATAVAMLVERGDLAFDDPVREHIPSFDNYQSGFMTIRQLLSHTSGFRINTLFLEPYALSDDIGPTLQTEVERFGDVGAAVTPGTTYSYSNPGYNTLGALIEIASGQPLEAFLRDAIYRPLGMSDSYHMEVAELLDGKLERMGAVYYTRDESGRWVPGWKPGGPPQVPFVRASGGMISTAWDYAIFLQTHLNDGAHGSVRLLEAETARLMTDRHTPDGGTAYGFGWNLLEDGGFGHGGSDGTFAWVDRARDVIGIVFTQTPRGRNPRDRFRELVNLSIDDPEN